MNNQPLKICIQGLAGCFHDAAARRWAGSREVETIPCTTFNDLFGQLENDASLLGICAIENTIAGSLVQNHELLRHSNLTIIGELKMRISHVLAALPGETLDTITEVNSHPMALMQCEAFLRSHPSMKVIEKFDTAGAAREIAEGRLTGHAAVCGSLAAELYGLTVLESGIETNKRNFTRFLIVADPVLAAEMKPRNDMIDKASVVFTLPHVTGALAKVLSVLSFYGLNLSKIQSLPIVGREWEYRFYADLTFDSYAAYRQALSAACPLMNDFKILGEYVECK